MCAINCLSLKSYLISTAECPSTRYRQGQQRDEEAGLIWLNSKFRIQIIYRIALVIRTGREKFGLLFKLYSNCIFTYDVSVRHVTIIK